MAFSLDSKVKDILKNPAAAAVLDKYMISVLLIMYSSACAFKYV